MRPFDIEAALRGEPVVTRDGQEVTQLMKFDTTDSYSVYGIVGTSVECWTVDGKFYLSMANLPKDIFMAPKKKKVWVNFYHSGIIFMYESEQLADSSALVSGGRIGNKAYPVEIEVDE